MSHQVVDRLQVYEWCPICGANEIDRKSPPKAVCRKCGLALYCNPCPAAAAILVSSDRRVLLVRRAQAPQEGKLAFPGGFVNDDESVESALRREVAEEVEVDLGDDVSLKYLLSHPESYVEGNYEREGGAYRVRYRTIDLFFVAVLPELHAKSVHNSEVSEVLVVPFEQVVPEELAFESMRVAWQAFLERERLPPSATR